MEKYVLQLVIGIIFSFVHIIVWSFAMNKKIKFLNIKTLLLIFLLANIMAINYIYMLNYLKILVITIIMMGFCKILFKSTLKEAIIAPIASQLTMLAAEFIFALIFFNTHSIFNTYVGTLLPNIIIAIIALVLVKIKFAKILYKLFDKLTLSWKKYSLLLFALILIITINFVEVNIYYEVDLRTLIIVNIILMITYAIIIFKIAQTQNKYLSISNRYNNSKKSLTENQSVINRYRIDNHENKSQLEILRGKIDPENKEAIDYIDKILGTRVKANEEVLNKTKIVPESDFKLLIDAKVMKMEEKKINNTIHVDKKITTTDFIEMDSTLVDDVCKVLGVFLDNAIEAVEKLDKKEIQIDMYKIDKCIYMSVINNYEGNIKADKINNPGYTTKSDGHGYGLALVGEIVDKNRRLSKETYVDKDIFKQVLKIKCKN